MGGAFWQYWRENGGLAQKGYPLSPEMLEVSATDGQEYVVHYFERAVFEWHQDNAPTHDLLLSQPCTKKAGFPAYRWASLVSNQGPQSYQD